ncbi:hypothetical protein CH92_07880 [Stutzerimonas stutzeri]|uniref:Uncharacterized protein n=1 Tax=Stutzerimonas stutzeri TaxID=316 RepID=W8RD04_STUST|nr:hypothetical protein CH92_07880 [Stutzerimonas stutzeri]
MLRLTCLFSTAVLAAVASIQPPDAMHAPDYLPATLKQPSALTTQKLSAPAQIISQEVSNPVQPQRWIF